MQHYIHTNGEGENKQNQDTMTELQLYKFITTNAIEWHWIDDKTDVILFVQNFLIEDFHKLFPSTAFDEAGIICHMKDGYFAFKMDGICEYHGIDINSLFGELTEP